MVTEVPRRGRFHSDRIARALPPMEASDLLCGLPSLRFEAPLDEDGKRSAEDIRVRAWARSVCSCSHAAFVCRLLAALRCKVLENSHFPHSWMAKFQILKSNSGCLSIGVLGDDDLGKQLVLVLIHHAYIAPKHITISSSWPEALDELMDLGVHCICDNQRLATSVDVLFLCCQPFQLKLVASKMRGHISKTCIVYSLVTAVPARRLQHLLGHCNIVRPQYIFQGDLWARLWEKNKNIAESLLDQEVVEETSPFKEPYLKFMKPTWFEEVLYSALNTCYLLKVPHMVSVTILNDLLFSATHGLEAFSDPDLFVCESFIDESFAQSLSQNSPFPWFDLSSMSQQDTPLTRFFSMHPRLQLHLSFVYHMTMLKSQGTFNEECCRD
ncbi:NADP-dependent oxidoreductase domain-containing protein 1 [Narcine bancroftii]|uniref:NADP-dependent oxidoreductase domain-containing protein 1 n=1 Tax=Narcine bancroftii TaxID=1343680 RepID=UPI003831B8E7